MNFLKYTVTSPKGDASHRIRREVRKQRLMAVIGKSQKFKSKSFLESVGFAWEGVVYALNTQRNFRIDLVFSITVIAAGIFFHISPMEWVAVVFTIAFVMVCELINTAIELMVDMWTGGKFDRNAKRIKDVSAAACLLMAGCAAMIGMLVFVPKIWPGITP